MAHYADLVVIEARVQELLARVSSVYFGIVDRRNGSCRHMCLQKALSIVACLEARGCVLRKCQSNAG